MLRYTNTCKRVRVAAVAQGKLAYRKVVVQNTGVGAVAYKPVLKGIVLLLQGSERALGSLATDGASQGDALRQDGGAAYAKKSDVIALELHLWQRPLLLVFCLDEQVQFLL